jgi:hypothetical protein
MRNRSGAGALVALVVVMATGPALASGLSITKVSSYQDPTVSDPRFDAINCRMSWKLFQPTNSTTIYAGYYDSCVAEAAKWNKVAILELVFTPGDLTKNETIVPAWATAAGVHVVQDVNRTNIFPVWWNATFKTYAKNAISKLIERYDADARVVGYMASGFSGVLPTSLAGEQSAALCDNFKAEGLTGTCEESAQSQTIASGSPYGIAVREMLDFWTDSTAKPVVYVARPLDPGSLAVELEADPVGNHPNVVVVNNGFRDCDGNRADIISRFQTLQAQGHIVGWWSLSVNGFPEDQDGNILPGEIAKAITCAVDDLDEQNLWFALTADTWLQYPDAIDTMYYALHPGDLPPPPPAPTGLVLN